VADMGRTEAERSATRPTHADDAHELYRANIDLLGWAHSILNAESPEDGKAGLLKVGDRLDTWPRRAATEIVRLRAERDLLAAAVRAWKAFDEATDDEGVALKHAALYDATQAAMAAVDAAGCLKGEGE
jgi:hypothetical protein